MRIRPLNDDDRIIAMLASWHVAEWSHLFEGWDEDACARELRECLHDEHLPCTWIVEDEGGVQGSVGLIPMDSEELSDIPGPWLASMYVHPRARGRGYGQALVREVMRHAGQTGIARLHLFTPHHAEFYKALGWQPVASRKVQGETVQVMRYETSSGDAHV